MSHLIAKRRIPSIIWRLLVLVVSVSSGGFGLARCLSHGYCTGRTSLFCRSVALIHALAIPDADGEDDMSASLSLFFLRAIGFLLPCYIMAFSINILQRPRQRQLLDLVDHEASAFAAAQISFVLQSGQRRGLQFTIASASNNSATQPHEPV